METILVMLVNYLWCMGVMYSSFCFLISQRFLVPLAMVSFWTGGVWVPVPLGPMLSAHLFKICMKPISDIIQSSLGFNIISYTFWSDQEEQNGSYGYLGPLTEGNFHHWHGVGLHFLF